MYTFIFPSTFLDAGQTPSLKIIDFFLSNGRRLQKFDLDSGYAAAFGGIGPVPSVWRFWFDRKN